MFYIIERAVTQTDTLICLVKFVGNGASMVAQMVNNLPIMQETWLLSPAQEDPLKKGMATHSHTTHSCVATHTRILQYSCLENFMDRGAWWATVHGVAKSWT